MGTIDRYRRRSLFPSFLLNKARFAAPRYSQLRVAARRYKSKCYLRMSMISVIYVKGNAIIYTWSIVVTLVDFRSTRARRIQDDSYSLPSDVEREAALFALFLFQCEIADGSKTDNGSQCKVLSRRLHRHTSCRPGRPADRVDRCCTFHCRTDKRCLL